MPKAKIESEMRPKGRLREEIKELASLHGAYIIASSKDSVSKSMMNDRLAAMATAVGRVKGYQHLDLHFYDRAKVAQWVRSHPTWVTWVLSKVGKPVRGWSGFGNWTNSPRGNDPYIADETVRLQDRTTSNRQPVSVVDGIRNLRSILAAPQSSVRLVGLSGTGKTRLVEALFDDRISETPLNRDTALYTDISFAQHPDPVEMSNALVSSRTRITLIVDNCPPGLHRTLSRICTQPESLISLITVEYDVRDDLPEETNVFKLEPASSPVIEGLLRARFPAITEANIQQVARLSGGNARMAIAIANTVATDEPLGHLRDRDLFDRLFVQGNPEDKGLLKSAELCSLVYSFDGDKVGADSELASLGNLRSISAEQLYADVACLMSRDLVQMRNVWRAVLPHALANNLATNALNSIPASKVVSHFLTSPIRLLRSFAHRLSFLHTSAAARKVAIELLRECGPAMKYNRGEVIAMLENLAPVVPDDALRVFETAAAEHGIELYGSEATTFRWQICKTLWHIAYDEALFPRAAALLATFARHERQESSSPGRHFLKVLHQSRYSGTLASAEVRASFVDKCLLASDVESNLIGVELLGAALEDEVTGSHETYEFGARSRGYGYMPESRAAVVDWFSRFFVLVAKFGIPECLHFDTIRKLLSERLFGLWVHVELYREIAELSRFLANSNPWPEGWAAIRNVLRYRKQLSSQCIEEASKLEADLAPQDLAAKVRSIALSKVHHPFDFCEIDDVTSYTESYERGEKIAFELGIQLATKESDVVRDLCPEIVCCDGPRVFAFVRGVVVSSADPVAAADALVSAYRTAEPKLRRYNVLYGILAGLSEVNSNLASEALETFANDEEIASVFPDLQLTHSIDNAAFSRIRRSITNGVVDAFAFRRLSYSRLQRQLGDDRLLELLDLLRPLSGGVDVTLDVLSARFQDAENSSPLGKVRTFGRHFLSVYDASADRARRQEHDYDLEIIVRNCISEKVGSSVTSRLCKQIIAGFSKYTISHHDYPRLLGALAVARPEQFLDEMLLGSEGARRMRPYATYLADRNANPFDKVPDDTLIAWCAIDPVVRLPKAASAIVPFEINDKSEPLRWRSIAIAILDLSQDQAATLAVFSRSLFEFNSWAGYRSRILQQRAPLLQVFFDHKTRAVADWAKDRHARLLTEISAFRAEEERDRQRDNERFE